MRVGIVQIRESHKEGRVVFREDIDQLCLHSQGLISAGLLGVHDWEPCTYEAGVTKLDV